jgi:hypothetical protein
MPLAGLIDIPDKLNLDFSCAMVFETIGVQGRVPRQQQEKQNVLQKQPGRSGPNPSNNMVMIGL